MAIVMRRLQVGIVCGWLCIWPITMDVDASGKQPIEEKPITGAQSFNLTLDEREQLEREAKAGDAEAALRLSQYYGFAKTDLEREVLWLRKAAELGSASAQYNLAYTLIYVTEYKNLSEARKWLDRAKQSAAAEGKTELQRQIQGLEEELKKETSSIKVE